MHGQEGLHDRRDEILRVDVVGRASAGHGVRPWLLCVRSDALCSAHQVCRFIAAMAAASWPMWSSRRLIEASSCLMSRDTSACITPASSRLFAASCRRVCCSTRASVCLRRSARRFVSSVRPAAVWAGGFAHGEFAGEVLHQQAGLGSVLRGARRAEEDEPAVDDARDREDDEPEQADGHRRDNGGELPVAGVAHDRCLSGPSGRWRSIGSESVPLQAAVGDALMRHGPPDGGPQKRTPNPQPAVTAYVALRRRYVTALRYGRVKFGALQSKEDAQEARRGRCCPHRPGPGADHRVGAADPAAGVLQRRLASRAAGRGALAVRGGAHLHAGRAGAAGVVLQAAGAHRRRSCSCTARATTPATCG